MKKSVLLLASVGIGAGLFYVLRFNRRKERIAEGTATDDSKKEFEQLGQSRTDGRVTTGTTVDDPQIQIDDRGTDQSGASQILKSIRDRAFEASDEKLALALGRPTEEIAGWTSGAGMIDGDVLMKARALALQRGLAVE
jgi:hypothetical protein